MFIIAKRIINTMRAMLATAALGAALPAAHAAVVVYEDVGFFNGVGVQSNAFTISSAGLYQATLTDFKFPTALSADFGLLVGTSNTELGRTDSAGSFTFEATPGTYWPASMVRRARR